MTCCWTFIWDGTSWARMGALPTSWCDSVSYTIVSGSGGNTTLQLNGTITSGFPGTVTSWDWAVCDDALCFGDTGQYTTWNQFTTTDTLKACLTTMLDINGATYTCLQCDSLVYDGFSGWMMMNMGNPVAITELQLNTIDDGKMYDLLGREVTEPQIGVMYIRNQKKYIRIK